MLKPPEKYTCFLEKHGILLLSVSMSMGAHTSWENLPPSAERKGCSVDCCFPSRAVGPNSDSWTMRRDRNSDQEKLWAPFEKAVNGSKELTEFCKAWAGASPTGLTPRAVRTTPHHSLLIRGRRNERHGRVKRWERDSMCNEKAYEKGRQERKWQKIWKESTDVGGSTGAVKKYF